jgi:hypothetical protein
MAYAARVRAFAYTYRTYNPRIVLAAAMMASAAVGSCLNTTEEPPIGAGFNST